MFHLIVTACLLNQPDLCAPRLLPRAEAATAEACAAAAPAVMADWGAPHGLTLSAPHCVMTEALPRLELTEIAPGVLVHLGTVAPAEAENRGRIANVGVVIAPDGVTVIDPGGSRAEAEALYIAIRARSPAPIRAAILTHAHPDHSFGADFFAEAGATLIAGPHLADDLAPRADNWMGAYRQRIGMAEMLGSAFALPATSDSPAGFTLYPLPPAHSGADLMVRHDASGTVFAGDVVFRGLTPVLDGSLNGWLAVLDGDLPKAQRIVPGHGPIAADWAEATTPLRAYLTALRDATRAQIAAGAGLSQAIPAIIAATQPQAAGWADFTATTERNAATAYAELEWE